MGKADKARRKAIRRVEELEAFAARVTAHLTDEDRAEGRAILDKVKEKSEQRRNNARKWF